ncbi:MAG: shikimate kinase [Dehalococcoidia bacterium]|nr:shikimate kinase [Dehalococcoidia bacterium]
MIGFSATGKSHSGRLAAQSLGAAFVDMDRLIVRRAGKQISEIFEDDGEDAFRRIEREVLREISGEPGRRVVSTGGGVPVDVRNREVMAASGLTIRLMASAETIHGRINRPSSRRNRRSGRQAAVRPMLAGSEAEETAIERVRQLLDEREDAYASAADVAIDTEGREPPDVAAEIVALIRSRTDNSEAE